jgi:hypothetical protein
MRGNEGRSIFPQPDADNVRAATTIPPASPAR